MQHYSGLIIAVENYHASNKISRVMFAKNDAEAFRDSLVALGCEKDRFEYLDDNLATKTSIIEKAKDLAQRAMSNETLILYYAGHGCNHNGRNKITSVDSTLDKIPETTIDIQELLSIFEGSDSKKVIAFLDCCHSGLEFSAAERSPLSEFETDALKLEYRNAEHLTVFASAKSNEKSQADFDRTHGAWSYYLIRALRGEATGYYDGSILFSDQLQRYLATEVPQRVKMITERKKVQTPVKFGKETADKFIVADLSKVFAAKDTQTQAEAIKLEKATILTSEVDLVRSLPGFKSGFQAPKKIDSYHEGWIQKIAKDLITQELNDVASNLRDKLRYKRKDIQEPIVSDGAGQLSTTSFDYVIRITQSTEKADRFVLTRSLENFKDGDILNNEIFNEIFKDAFNTLELRLSKKLDVANIIDKIEEIDNREVIDVDYEQTDLSTCQITIKGFDGQIILTERTFSIKMNKKRSPKSLAVSCRNAYESIGQQGIQKMLSQG